MAGVYRAIFRASIAVMLQYRIALLIWMLAHITEPLIHLVVWTTVAGSGPVAGYAAADFAAYYIALFVVNHATFTFIIYEYEFEIREGRLSAKLLKPLTPMHMYLADNISWKLLSTTVTLPVAALLTWHFRPEFHPVELEIALFVPALVLAFGVRWLLEYTLGARRLLDDARRRLQRRLSTGVLVLGRNGRPERAAPRLATSRCRGAAVSLDAGLPHRGPARPPGNRRYCAGVTHPMPMARLGLWAAPVRLGRWRAAV